MQPAASTNFLTQFAANADLGEISYEATPLAKGQILLRFQNLGSEAKSINVKSFAQSLWQQANGVDTAKEPRITEMTLTGEVSLAELHNCTESFQ